MTNREPSIDVLLCQKFLPEAGGSIRWMYEVYRQWPTPVDVITHDYYAVPPRTPEFPEVPPPPNGKDHVTDANLKMDRRDIFIHDWGVESPRRLRRYARMTRAVRERFSRHEHVRVHCIHAVPEVVSLIPLKWRYGRRLSVICYAHGEEITACRSSRQLRFLMDHAHAVVDLMIANSQYTATVLKEHIDPAKVRVVNPGVQTSDFANTGEAGQQWRQDQQWADKLVVLTVGRLDPRKNHATMIQAVARLRDRFPGLVYVVVGQGREMDALLQQAVQLGVSDAVVLAGSVDTATKLAMYGGCDVFAMPAIQDGTDVEGFGMVFLEAGACGKPCIAGRVGGQAEAVIDGQTGFVVNGTDLSAVTNALQRLLEDESLRRRMGEAGLTHARSRDWANVVQQTAQLVENMQ